MSTFFMEGGNVTKLWFDRKSWKYTSRPWGPIKPFGTYWWIEQDGARPGTWDTSHLWSTRKKWCLSSMDIRNARRWT